MRTRVHLESLLQFPTQIERCGEFHFSHAHESDLLLRPSEGRFWNLPLGSEVRFFDLLCVQPSPSDLLQMVEVPYWNFYFTIPVI
jgi:hypothetical protein